MFQKEIAEIVHKHAGVKREEVESSLETPPSIEMGDYALPCFFLAKHLKKNPVNIAEDLQEKIKPEGIIEKTETKGPYLNFFINKKELTKRILENIKKDYGKQDEKNETIVIDFSSPNVGKPMHVGHIRSTIIGDSLMRTFDFLGYETVGINYLGDIGLHIGKLIVAYEFWVDKKALKQDPVKELLRLYVKFCEKEKSEFQEGTDEDFEGNEWTQKAREELKKIELGDEKAHKIWKEIIDCSGKGFDRVYKILNTNFYETTGQSKFGNLGREIILENAKKGLVKVEKETGAVYIEFGDVKKYILRTGGIPSYMTQDIGAAISRYKKYKFDKMIYVTDFRQKLHFENLFEILKRFDYDFYKNCKHLEFGTVNFGGEIMATRAGKIILLEDVLKKTIEKAQEEINKRKTKGDAEDIGVGAIKYAIIKSDPIKDVQFSWEQALNFEGDTGPYLQYSYARASSIMKKSSKKPKLKITIEPSKKEIELIKKLNEFPVIIKNCSKSLNPSIIAHYSYQLCQIFNEFYHNCKVIGSEDEELKLKIIECFRITLKNSLHLLGIEVMEEM